MADPRITRLAQVLIHYSLRLRRGEWLVISGPSLAEELLKASLVEALKTGAFVTLRPSIPDAAYLTCRYAREPQLRFIAPTERLEMEKADALLVIWGGWNTKELTGIDPKRLSLVRKARRPLFELMLQREARGELRWVGTQFPTAASAQDAEMALVEYQDFVYGAGMVDRKDPIGAWRRVSARQRALIRRLSRLKEIRIVGPDTDIRFGVAGRRWVNCDGHVNFPDGEVFTSPREELTEGYIRYTFPAVYGGREVEDIRLRFRRGRVVEARAGKGEDYLKALLETDAGARYVGELSFGTNYAIRRFTKNTLFDEKIGGTMHVALGAALPGTGGRNRSGLHWDMVCDTRKGFVVYGDGRPILKNGRFV